MPGAVAFSDRMVALWPWIEIKVFPALRYQEFIAGGLTSLAQ